MAASSSSKITSSADRHEHSIRTGTLAVGGPRSAASPSAGDPAPPATRHSGPPRSRLPDEVPADRPTQLDLVADDQDISEVRRHLAVVEPLDRDRHARPVGGRRDRVAALGRVAVLGGETDVDVLSRQVAGPIRDVEGRGCGRAASRRYGRRPRRWPRSVAGVPLFPPRVAVVVVAVALPEARGIGPHAARWHAPTSRSSRSTGAAPAGVRARHVPARVAHRRTRTHPRLPAAQVIQRRLVV